MLENSFTLLQKPLDPKQTQKNILRRFLWMWPILMIALSIGGYFIYQYYTHKLEQSLLASENNFIATTSQLLQKEIHQQMMVLQMAAKSQIVTRYFQAETAEEEIQRGSQVAALFINLSNTFQSQDQIRLISNNGHEMVKTTYDAKLQQSAISTNLFDLNDRQYYQPVKALKPNEAYVSKMELSLHNDKIEIPHKPILRFATPVLGNDGQKVGTLMINYLAKDFLNSFRNKQRIQITGYGMLLDSLGFWLSHHDNTNEWGRDLNNPENNFEKKYPSVWKKVHEDPSGSIHSELGLFRFQSIQPFDFNDIHYFPSVKKLTIIPESIQNTNWKLVIFIPIEMIHQHSFFFKPAGLAIIFTLLFLMSALLYLLNVLYEQKHYQLEYDKRATAELTDLYENAPCGYNTLDKQGYIKRINNTLAQWLGYDKSEILDKHFSEFLTPESKTLFNNLIEALNTEQNVEGITLEVKCKNGDTFHVSLVATGIKDRNRLVIARTTVFNISDRIKLEKRLEYIANTDPLTGVKNRRYFFEKSHALFPPNTNENTPIAALMLDIDHFKSINDQYGHKVGDIVLTAFCREVEKHINEDDIFTRIGGEEFALLYHPTSPQDTVDKAEKLREAIENLTVDVKKGVNIKMTVSIGCAYQKNHHIDIDQLMQQADDALYQAKLSGRNKVALH